MRKLRTFLIALGAMASPAFAQNVNLTLGPAEVAAIVRAMDRWPLKERPPAGWWDVQLKLKQATETNPQAAASIYRALDKTRSQPK